MNISEISGAIITALSRVPNGTIVEMQIGGIRYGINHVLLTYDLTTQTNPIIILTPDTE